MTRRRNRRYVYRRMWRHPGPVVDIGCLRWRWSRRFCGKKAVLGIDPQGDREPAGATLMKAAVVPDSYDCGTALMLGHGLSARVVEGGKMRGDLWLCEVVSWTEVCEWCDHHGGHPSVVKMNIEGSELAALKGMSETISRNKNLKIITEFCPEFLERARAQPASFVTMLAEHGFALFDVLAGEPVGPSQISAFAGKYQKKGGLTFLLCVKS